MQLRRKHPKNGISKASGKNRGALLRLSALAALLLSLIYVTSVAWRPDSAVAQDASETQLGVVLSANQEAPPVAVPSTAKGAGTVTVSADQTTVSYTLTLTGPFTGDPQQAHIHVGPTGSAGPVIFFLCSSLPEAPEGVQPCPLAVGGEVKGMLTEAEFNPQPEAGIETFSDAIDALISGGTYANVHTVANTPGEIRGQIGVALQTALSSEAEVPPVTTPTMATGTGLAVLNKDHSQIDYAVSLTGPFTGDPQQAHIHAGLPGASGPVIFFLCSSLPEAPVGVQPCPLAAGGNLSGALTEAALMQQLDAGVETFADAVATLLRGGTYINVHTPANGSGEIRGQLEPVQPEPELVSFALDIQPIFNAICSCHLFDTPAGLSLAAGEAYANLVNVPSSQVPFLNRVTPGDPDNSYLYMKHVGAPGITGGRMPQGDSTFFDRNPDLLELERQWILEGALNN